MNNKGERIELILVRFKDRVFTLQEAKKQLLELGSKNE